MSMNLSELLKIAEAATPGEWRACGHDRGGCQCGMVWGIKQDFPVADCNINDEMIGKSSIEDAKSNSLFIAAFNPSVAIEIIKQLQEAEKDAARYRWLRGVGCDSWLYKMPRVKVWPPTATAQTRLCGRLESLDNAIDAAINGGKE